MERITEFTKAPVTVHHPHGYETPFVASIPHSGTYIPPLLKGLYTQTHLSRLRNTDWHLQDIYDFLPELGVTTIEADFSRYVIDVNRGLEQLSGGQSYRSSLIYTKDTWGDPILKDAGCDLREEFRIAHFYRPFHAILQETINAKIERFGHAYVLDMHSFAVETEADICLGAGRHGDKGADLKDQLSRDFNAQGFTLASLPQFSGGHIVRHYGAQPNVEACMIELKYNTYMRDNSADGDHMPQLDPVRANATKSKLKKALTGTINAFESISGRRQGYARLSL